MLLRHGWRQTEIAAAAGVALLDGEHGEGSWVTINAETAERILAVQPGQSRR